MDRARLAVLSVEQVLGKSPSWEYLGEYPFLFFLFPYPNPFVYIQSEAIKKKAPLSSAILQVKGTSAFLPGTSTPRRKEADGRREAW